MSEKEKEVCLSCGDKFEKSHNWQKYCKAACQPKRKDTPERRAKSVVRVANRRRKLKELALEYKGGKCEICGYNKCIRALEFHHKDPTQKDFSVSVSGVTRSWDRLKVELDKCQLVCANCHREIHEELEKSTRE